MQQKDVLQALRHSSADDKNLKMASLKKYLNNCLLPTESQNLVGRMNPTVTMQEWEILCSIYEKVSTKKQRNKKIK